MIILLLLLLLAAQCAHSQDSSRNVLIDSAKVEIGQYAKLDLRSSSAYIRQFEYSTALNMSSGISVYNALRGRLPGLTIPSYFAVANSSGMRSGPFPFANDALIVIDGMPFNNYIGGYANLNAFDYSSIAAFSNASSLNFLGGANSGAFVLNSKSGEGVTGPLFEFNAYTTYGWGEFRNLQTNLTEKIDEWNFANAIAYSQDFGKIDTRVSYTLQKKSFQSVGEPYIHYLKLNTGLVAIPKLDLRLIVDGRYSRYDDPLPPRGSSPATADQSKGETFFNGNLMAKYKINDWLALTSQMGVSSYHADLTTTGQGFGRTSARTNSFTMGNLLVSGSKQVGERVKLSGFAGYQLYDHTQREANSAYGLFGGTSESIQEDKYPYFLGQANFGYGNRFNLAVSYRDGTHSNSANTRSPAQASSAAFSLIFSDWIGKSFLDFGKFRASIGSQTVVPFTSYPTPDTQTLLLQSGQQYPYDVSNSEIGLDLGFMQSRLHVTLNYYQNQEQYSVNVAPGGITKYETHGWESDIRLNAIKKPSFAFETGLVLSNSISRFDIVGRNASESSPYLRLGWLNQFQLKSVRLAMLIESFNNYTGYASNTGFVASSFTMLRDISLEIRLPDTFLFGLNTHRTTFSIIGRNLAKIGGSGPDLDAASGLSLLQKSASINLNVTF